MLLCKIASAQIVNAIIITAPACNNATLGSAKVKVTNTNPPYTYLWSDGQITATANDLVPNIYTIKVTDGLSKDTTITVIIPEMTCEMVPELFFTPNADGYNDTWSIGNSQYFSNALVLVYNRWGQKVYEHYGLYHLPWDGKDLLGVNVPDASYFYIVFKDRDKKSELIKGSVSIIR